MNDEKLMQLANNAASNGLSMSYALYLAKEIKDRRDSGKSTDCDALVALLAAQ